MSKIEMKVIFDDEENPVINLSEVNCQIINYFKGIIEFKEKQGPKEIINLMHHAANIMLTKRMILWLNAISLVLTSGNPDIIIKFDKLLMEFSKKVIVEVENRKNKDVN